MPSPSSFALPTFTRMLGVVFSCISAPVHWSNVNCSVTAGSRSAASPLIDLIDLAAATAPRIPGVAKARALFLTLAKRSLLLNAYATSAYPTAPSVRETMPARPELPRPPTPFGQLTVVEFPTFDLRPEHRRIAAETLVITGADDFITGPVCAADLDGIPAARTAILEQCGHFIFVEQPERFREAVAGFLRG